MQRRGFLKALLAAPIAAKAAVTKTPEELPLEVPNLVRHKLTEEELQKIMDDTPSFVCSTSCQTIESMWELET